MVQKIVAQKTPKATKALERALKRGKVKSEDIDEFKYSAYEYVSYRLQKFIDISITSRAKSRLYQLMDYNLGRFALQAITTAGHGRNFEEDDDKLRKYFAIANAASSIDYIERTLHHSFEKLLLQKEAVESYLNEPYDHESNNPKILKTIDLHIRNVGFEPSVFEVMRFALLNTSSKRSFGSTENTYYAITNNELSVVGQPTESELYELLKKHRPTKMILFGQFAKVIKDDNGVQKLRTKELQIYFDETELSDFDDVEFVETLIGCPLNQKTVAKILDGV